MNTLAIRLRSPLHALFGALNVLRERPNRARGNKTFATLDGLNDHLLADIGLSSAPAKQRLVT
jgi:uncharacterized protein YjiS (DUF1127 family)